MERTICQRCRRIGHTITECRAKTDIFTKNVLPPRSDAEPKKQVYVLQCADDCFYVGVSDNLPKRFQQHASGEATAWTRLHPPIRFVQPYTNADLYLINPYGNQEMDEFYACVYNRGGVMHVRGGLYTDVHLSERDIRQIEQQVSAHFNMCFKCGFASHISGNCIASKKAAWKSGEAYQESTSVFDD